MIKLRKGLLSLAMAITMVGSMIPSQFVNAEITNNQVQSLGITETVDRKVVTYFPEWAYSKDVNDHYTADRMPWNKITHVNYAFAHVDKNTNKIAIGDVKAATEMDFPGVTNDFPYKGHFNVLNSYKKKYPNVKTLISIGGWAESTGFYTMTQTDTGIETFANSVVDFLRTYGFDGADIDYEYPTSLEDAGNPIDFELAKPYRKNLYTRYVKMMKVLREKIDAASLKNGKNYLLTAAVTASGWVVGGMGEENYTQYLDFLNLMTYDFHGSWNGYVAHNSPLYSDPRDPEVAGINYNYLSTDWAVKYYSAVMDPSKIVVGIPLYTRGWERVTPSGSGYPGGLYGTACNGSPADNEGFGATGIDNIWHDLLPDGTEEPGGSNPLWHVKNLLADKSLGYVRYWDDVSKVPYVWNAGKKVFLSFEDEQSMGEKMDYIVKNKLGGAMFWEVDGDFAQDKDGKYIIGDTLTTIAKNKLDAAGPLKVSQPVNDKPTMDYDMEIINNFDHPYNSYKINFINNTGKAIAKPWKIEFDLPNSIKFKTQPYVSGATVKTEEQGFNIHVTITSDTYASDLGIGKTTLMEGDMTLKPFSGPKNMVCNGYSSKAEWDRKKVDINLKAPTISSSTVDSRDGNYTITVNVPENSRGKTVNLYEGNKIVKTVNIDNTANVFTYNVIGNTNGNYNYKAIITDGRYELESNTVSVYVGPQIDLRAATVTTSTAGSTTGEYKVTVNLPANSNATTLELYENGVKIKEEIVDNTAKVFNYDIKGKASGLYTYKAVTKNRALSKESASTSVKVSIANNYPDYSASTTYKVGDIVIYKGRIYKSLHYPLTGLAPDVFTNLWQDLGPVVQPNPNDILDLAIAAEKYNTQKGESVFSSEYDLNNDSIIDIYDMILLARKF